MTGSQGRKMKQNVLSFKLEWLPGNEFGVVVKLTPKVGEKNSKTINTLVVLWKIAYFSHYG